MEMNNLFIMASRKKFRFAFKGMISVEDLWDLSLKELDMIFKSLNAQYKAQMDEESLLTEKTDGDAVLEAKIQIIKYIVQTKKDEIAAREQQAAKKAQKEKILEIIAAKKDQQLKDTARNCIQDAGYTCIYQDYIPDMSV